jgi:hypothetical protein
MILRVKQIPWRRLLIDAILLASMVLASSSWMKPR